MSVSALFLAEYESKKAFIAIAGTSSISLHNCKVSASSSCCCENGEMKTCTYSNYFVWVVSDIL